jgi:HEAT repeat protein
MGFDLRKLSADHADDYDEDGWPGRSNVHRLRRFKEALGPAMRQVEPPMEEVWAWEIESLYAAGPTALLDCLQHADPVVRRMAAYVLTYVDDDITPGLLKRLELEQDAASRMALLISLADRDQPLVLTFVEPGNSPTDRLGAAFGLLLRHRQTSSEIPDEVLDALVLSATPAGERLMDLPWAGDGGSAAYWVIKPKLPPLALQRWLSRLLELEPQAGELIEQSLATPEPISTIGKTVVSTEDGRGDVLLQDLAHLYFGEDTAELIGSATVTTQELTSVLAARLRTETDLEQVERLASAFPDKRAVLPELTRRLLRVLHFHQGQATRNLAAVKAMESICHELGQAGGADPDVRAALLKVCGDDDLEVRLGGARALTELGHPADELVPILVSLITDHPRRSTKMPPNQPAVDHYSRGTDSGALPYLGRVGAGRASRRAGTAAAARRGRSGPLERGAGVRGRSLVRGDRRRGDGRPGAGRRGRGQVER